MQESPDHNQENSPLKKKKGGLIISPERNPFRGAKNKQESPQKQGASLNIKLVNIEADDNNCSSPVKNIR